MDKIIYTRPDGGLSVVIPATKKSLERSLGAITDGEYEAHVKERSIPEDAINVRSVKPKDIPADRDFRNAWCDVTPESRIDINCTKAKDIQLSKMREKRSYLFGPLDVESIIALERGEGLSDISSKKSSLRNVTAPLSSLDTTGKINDNKLLDKIKSLDPFKDLVIPKKDEINMDFVLRAIDLIPK